MLGRAASEGAVAGTALDALNEYTPLWHAVHTVQTGFWKARSGRRDADSTAGMHCNKRCLALYLCVCRESPDPYIINSRGNCLNSLGRWSGAAGRAEQD